jgi:hypothetical protein
LIECGQPIRSLIIVAGIDGYAFTGAAQPAWSSQPRVGRDD